MPGGRRSGSSRGWFGCPSGRLHFHGQRHYTSSALYGDRRALFDSLYLMIRNPERLFAALALFALCSGCGPKGFDEAMAGVRLQEKPVNLDGEQLLLSESQVNCGVQNELWDAPMSAGDRMIARLLDKGRALKFYDDVVVRDGPAQINHVQIR